jgi:hypothetical protein
MRPLMSIHLQTPGVHERAASSSGLAQHAPGGASGQPSRAAPCRLCYATVGGVAVNPSKRGWDAFLTEVPQAWRQRLGASVAGSQPPASWLSSMLTSFNVGRGLDTGHSRQSAGVSPSNVSVSHQLQTPRPSSFWPWVSAAPPQLHRAESRLEPLHANSGRLAYH